MPKKSDVLTQVRPGAIVSAFLINGMPRGVIVTNNGEPPMLYWFDGRREALSISGSGKLVVPVEIEPGESLDYRPITEHYEISAETPLIKATAPGSDAVN